MVCCCGVTEGGDQDDLLRCYLVRSLSLWKRVDSEMAGSIGATKVEVSRGEEHKQV